MAMVYFSEHEWYPVRCVLEKNDVRPYHSFIELTEDELAFIVKSEADFRKSQELIDVKLNQKGSDSGKLE